MKATGRNRGSWLRKLRVWWFLFKCDVENIAWCEAPSEESWLAMQGIVAWFDEAIEAEEEGTLSPDDPLAEVAPSLLKLRYYLDDILNGPLLETRLGKRLFEAARTRRFAEAKSSNGATPRNGVGEVAR